jgi:hypothetical protein
VVEHLPIKCEDLSSNPNTTTRTKQTDYVEISFIWISQYFQDFLCKKSQFFFTFIPRLYNFMLFLCLYIKI